MHGAQATARFVVGIIGNIISFGLFLAPLPTFKRIWQKKSTEEFHPYPYLATLMNCIFWIWYGIPIVHPDSTLVVTTNGIGLALEIAYLSLFFYYTTKKNRVIILGVLFVELVVFAILAVITLSCFHTTYYRSMFVGIICIIFGTIMYAAPLSIVWKVFNTKSAEFLPFWLCFAGFLNGICWFGYAFLKKPDPYLMIPNGLGAVLGFIQLCVHTYYTHVAKQRALVQDDAKAGELQLEKQDISPV
ncbi:hypothetical protein CASFOL_033055 [Castilleja foliolosa]|uniref:Bidirectional sugar transporter SWEET n=1 Tax=Castilleja foliolosa TaxID=1961234 RepID=A0ABD3C3T9_9LAMI